MHKEDLRRQIRQIKRQYTPQQLEVLSLDVAARIEARCAEASVILAFYSLPDEPDTHSLVDKWVAEGKTVLLPKVINDELMQLRRYTGAQDLQEGAFHIMEPVGEPFTDYQKIDIVLVPGVAFDAQGHRLGRGKGYYDRFLSTLSSLTGLPVAFHSSLFTFHLIGVCFDFQKVSEVPVLSNDIPVDEVI